MGEVSASGPGRFLPLGKTRYKMYTRLGGPQGRSGQARKISPPPGFDPRNVNPLASLYTNYATRPTSFWIGLRNLSQNFDNEITIFSVSFDALVFLYIHIF